MQWNTIPSMQNLQTGWIPAHWGNLVPGAVIALTVKENVVICGTIDDFTFDKRIAWIFPQDCSPTNNVLSGRRPAGLVPPSGSV
ncbi:hypothetical protein ABIB17_003505 [Arthrobacter sp. UYEF6]